MIVTSQQSVLVQGITGRQGRYWTERMLECGTNIVGGTNPKRAGEEVHGVPVYASAADAVREQHIDATVLFVPPAAAKSAVIDAAEAGIATIVCLAEHIPSHDVMEMLAVARARGSAVLGPNTAGLVVPGESSVGIMPGFAENIFRPGNVGVVSRSGSLGTLVALNLIDDGFGQSAFVGVGGDPIVGTTTAEAVRALAAYEPTEAIVIVGEIGGAMEEAAAEAIAEIGLPAAAFIAGRSAPPNRRMGHAGAIVAGNRGGADSKVEALRAAGVEVVDVPSQIGPALRAAGVRTSIGARAGASG